MTKGFKNWRSDDVDTPGLFDGFDASARCCDVVSESLIAQSSTFIAAVPERVMIYQ